MKKAIFSLALATAFLLTLFSACNKDDEQKITDEDVESVQDVAYEDALMDNIYESVDDDMYTLDNSGYNPDKAFADKEDICRIITVDVPDSTSFPKTITIDYGDGCTSIINGDTITKSGVIQIVVTGRYFVQDSQRIMTFQDFFVNGMQVEGTRTVTSNGWASNFEFSWNISLEGGRLTFEDGTEVTREVSGTRTLVTNGTLIRTDDYWLVQRTASGINFMGDSYVREVIEPLQKNFGCPFFVSGVIEITRNETEVITIDFGDGTCDRYATITKDGETRTIMLRWRHRL